jgi:hypothetical protein
MIRTLGLVVTVVLLGWATPARAQFDFAIDPPGYSPPSGRGGFGYSGFGYGAYGPRGYGYYTGLYLPPTGNGPSGYYSPIFSSAMMGAPRPTPYDPSKGLIRGWFFPDGAGTTNDRVGRRLGIFRRR